MSKCFMWGCLTEGVLQAHFDRWLYESCLWHYMKVLPVDDNFNSTAILLPGVEVLEQMQSVYSTDSLAVEMRDRMLRSAPYAEFISDL
jgi:hypothetical protein